jgi:hypothetical protein
MLKFLRFWFSGLRRNGVFMADMQERGSLRRTRSVYVTQQIIEPAYLYPNKTLKCIKNQASRHGKNVTKNNIYPDIILSAPPH